MKRRGTYPHAIALIRGGKEAPQLFGDVRFYQNKNSVMVSGNINGLPYKVTNCNLLFKAYSPP
ncbi:MAG: hypothetical protein E7591_01505 [Ruminococcaceae bacterium]|nr:hypothetical protein [Oscillospiraceae bacterium]